MWQESRSAGGWPCDAYPGASLGDEQRMECRSESNDLSIALLRYHYRPARVNEQGVSLRISFIACTGRARIQPCRTRVVAAKLDSTLKPSVCHELNAVVQ